ncbi:hypothetical protein HMI54_003616, partial [Coelomomyces lativittatus]
LFSTVLFPKEEGKKYFHERGWFQWIFSTLNTSPQDILQQCGPDGAMLFIFIEMIMHFFIVATFICLVCIFPIHVLAVKPERREINTIYTISEVEKGSKLFFAHLVVAWILILLFHFLLFRAYKKVISIQKWHTTRPTIASRAILVSGIDPDSTESELKAYFHSLNIGEIEKVILLRHSKLLQKALEERWKWVTQLETLLANYPDRLVPIWSSFLEHDSNYVKNEVEPSLLPSNFPLSSSTSLTSPLKPKPHSALEPLSPSLHRTSPISFSYADMLSDATPLHPPPPFWKFWQRMSIEHRFHYYVKNWCLADHKVKFLRNSYPTHSQPLPIVMVIFQHPASTTLATQCVIHPDLFRFDVERMPESQDLNFLNLGVTPLRSIARRYLHMACLSILFLFWSVPVTFLTALFNLEDLAKRWPALVDFIKSNPTFYNLAQSILPTLGLTIFLALLPMILTLLSSLRMFSSQFRLSISVFASYFLFQLIYVLLIFTLSGPLYQSLNPKFIDFNSIVNLLATSLPKASYFFVNYTLLHVGVILPLSLIPIFPIVMYLLFRPKTPRQKSVAQLRPLFVPSDLTFSMIIWIIGLVYALLCPVILLPCLVYSIAMWFVWRYRLMYTTHMVDSRGTLFTHLTRMWLFAPFIFILLMIGQLSLSQFYWGPALIPLLLVHIYMMFWVAKLNRKLTSVPLDLWRGWAHHSNETQSVSSEVSFGTVRVTRHPLGVTQNVKGIDGMPLCFGQIDLVGTLPNVWVPDVSRTETNQSSSHLV